MKNCDNYKSVETTYRFVAFELCEYDTKSHSTLVRFFILIFWNTLDFFDNICYTIYSKIMTYVKGVIYEKTG